jgi:hypothetical protein
MVLSHGRSGGATSASDEAKKEQSGPSSDRRPTAEPGSLSIVGLEREQPTALIRSRDLVFVRNRRYRISAAERGMMTEIGKFRTIAVGDLARHRYPNEPGKLQEVQVLFRRWQGERVDSEKAFLQAHLSVAPTEELRQAFVPAAQIKDDGVGAIFLHVGQQEIQQEAFARACRAEDDSMCVVLVMEI